jgi:predicted aspartyl protease
MGRVVVFVTLTNVLYPESTIAFDALVDTGAAYTTLPNAWRNRLGVLRILEKVEVETADQSVIQGEICGPVEIRIEGFRSILTEVLFIDMEPDNGSYDPQIGYTTLELAHAAVDMVGHRLINTKRVDLK